jgi:hypothetical protein
MASVTKRPILPWAAAERAAEPLAPAGGCWATKQEARATKQEARAASSRLRRHRYTAQGPTPTADPWQRHLRSRYHDHGHVTRSAMHGSPGGRSVRVSGGQLGGAITLMIGPIAVFSLVSAALWAGSLFYRPQARCTRCTGGTPHFGSFLTGSSGLCRKCRGTGWRERPGVGVLRSIGWDIGPTGKLQRRGEPAAGTDRGPRLGPHSANPGSRPGSLPWQAGARGIHDRLGKGRTEAKRVSRKAEAARAGRDRD